MSAIASIEAMEVLDSRGCPTVQVNVKTEKGGQGYAIVPSGASRGSHEAKELRDSNLNRYGGRGVTQAVQNVNQLLSEILMGEQVQNQQNIDQMMVLEDDSSDKSRIGANAILAASLAIARAAASELGIPLYRYIGGCFASSLPCPMMNIINGGAHTNNSLDFQEFMIRPIGAPTFQESLRWGSEIYQQLGSILKNKGHITAVGDEGGFAPNLSSNEEALEIILQAIETAGYKPQEEITIALDCAAGEFYCKESQIYYEKKKKLANSSYRERNAEEMIDYLSALCSKYPIDSIEDGLDETDWRNWPLLTDRLGEEVQVVGDDIFVTQVKFLRRGILEGVGNAILIKLNQVGTLTETLQAARFAQINAYSTIVSHRSGDTEDSFIADLAVAVNAGQIKAGAPCRSDRTSKYNRLLSIEKELGSCASYGF